MITSDDNARGTSGSKERWGKLLSWETDRIDSDQESDSVRIVLPSRKVPNRHVVVNVKKIVRIIYTKIQITSVQNVIIRQPKTV